MTRRLRFDSIIFVFLLGLTVSAFSQKLAWEYDLSPSSPTSKWVRVERPPYVAANGDILLVTYEVRADDSPVYGVLWLSARGAKLAALEVPEGVSQIINATAMEVSFLGGVGAQTYRRTLKQVGPSLVLLRSVNFTEIGGGPLTYFDSFNSNRLDTRGFVAGVANDTDARGVTIQRYLY